MEISVWLPCIFEHLLILFLWYNLSVSVFCLSMVLKCLASFLVLINSLYSSKVSSLILLSRLVLHVSHWWLNMLMVLLIDLILSFNKAFSALIIIYWPLGVLMLLLSLILTGMISSERHLRENLL